MRYSHYTYGKSYSIIQQPPNPTLFSDPIECRIGEISLYSELLLIHCHFCGNDSFTYIHGNGFDNDLLHFPHKLRQVYKSPVYVHTCLRSAHVPSFSVPVVI